MAQQAPKYPTTELLHSRYPVSIGTRKIIADNRRRASDILSGNYPGVLGVMGPCPLTMDELTIQGESTEWADFAQQYPDMFIARRLPPYKPRNDPTTWSGMETDRPEDAFRILRNEANRFTPLAIEIAFSEHIRRYGHLLTLGWIGAKNVENTKLLDAVATGLPDLPLLIKNGEDGSLSTAINAINRLRGLRKASEAPVTLLYRGGKLLDTPDKWEEGYFEAYDLTDGMFVADGAHGAMRAHDPGGRFDRSVAAGKLAMSHIVSLAQSGYAPLGFMSETSRAISPIDPPIPIEVAEEGLAQIYVSRMATVAA